MLCSNYKSKCYLCQSASVKSIIFADKNIFYKKLNYKFAVKKNLKQRNKIVNKLFFFSLLFTLSALEITADHRSMIGGNLAVIGRMSPLVIIMIGRNIFLSNLRASYIFPASFFVSLLCLFRITLLPASSHF